MPESYIPQPELPKPADPEPTGAGNGDGLAKLFKEIDEEDAAKETKFPNSRGHFLP